MTLRSKGTRLSPKSEQNPSAGLTGNGFSLILFANFSHPNCMATTLDEISGFLDEDGIPHHRRENDVVVFFTTLRYVDSQGENVIRIVILPSENGQYFEVFCPGVYNCAQSPHKAIALQTLLIVSWETKFVQFEYNENNGEIWAKIEFPLADAPLTKRQLFRCLAGLTQIVDQFDPAIRGALERGVIEWPAEIEASRSIERALASGGGADVLRRFAEFLAQQEGGASGSRGDGKGGDLGLDD
jgi:hypothetical protein